MNPLQIQLPLGAGWRPDLLSLATGIVVGILLSLALRWLWPRIRRLIQRVSGRFRQLLAWMRSGVEVRYQAELVEYAQQTHLGCAWASLDDIFIPPLIVIPDAESEKAPGSDWAASQLTYLWPELAAGIASPTPPTITVRQLLLNPGRTVISAPAGAGKTTLLAYIAMRVATATAGGSDAPLLSLLPMFLHLSELDLVPEDREEPVAPLTSAIQRRSSPLTSPGVKGLLEQKLKAGHAVILLDGWDDLPANRHHEVADWLSRLLALHPGTQIVAAASVTGYGPLVALDFTPVGLLPWHAGQVESFAGRWTKALSLSQPPHLNYFWRPGQSSLDTALRFWILYLLPETGEGNEVHPRGSNDLARHALPLFHEAGEAKIDEAEDPGKASRDSSVNALWKQIAFHLASEGKLSLSQGELSAEIAAALAENGSSAREDAARLQKSVAESPLFTALPGGAIRFQCTAWRDFLAATHMADTGMADLAAERLSDSRWAGILRHYVAQAGATELAANLLSGKEQTLTRDGLFQTASWMPEAPDSGEWRRQTMILLGQIIRQSTFTFVLRQRAVAALAQSGEKGVSTFLSQLLERSDPFLRQAGTAALSHLGTVKAIRLLGEMLEDGSSQVRQAAVNALAWSFHPATEHSLLMALIDGDDALSRIAAEGLARNGAEGAEILKEAIEDEDPRVRRAAVHGLALLDGDWVKSLLSQLERKDEEWLVRSAASVALEAIGGRENPPDWRPIPIREQQWLVDHAAEEGRTVPKGEAALPYLVQILAESSSPELRAAAAASLGQIAALDALPALETAVQDKDKLVSEASYATLCLIRRAYGTA